MTRQIVASLAVLLILASCSSMVTAQNSTKAGSTAPEVISPKDKQRIGEGNDPLCPAAPKACYKIRAGGRVPDGLIPFLVVEPLLVRPRTWIQPPIPGVRGDGSFFGLVYLGEEHNGVGEYFKIYVFTCKDAERLHEGDQIHQFPKDCLVSDPVEVYRVR